VVGGWAIDLYLGEQTREHEDLEVAISRDDFALVRDVLHRFVFHTVGDGAVRVLGRDAQPPADKHQNWILDIEANAWRMDVMIEPGNATTWIYRRDESLRAPREFMVATTRDGIPYLGPHGVLLFKAKHQRPKDEADFDRCLPVMHDDAKSWLATSLDRMHPNHPWIARLRSRDQ